MLSTSEGRSIRLSILSTSPLCWAIFLKSKDVFTNVDIRNTIQLLANMYSNLRSLGSTYYRPHCP
jgi:hypothetical protein